MPDTRAVVTLSDWSSVRFVDSSVTRRRLVTELHLTGPMTLAELVRATGRSRLRLRRQLRALRTRGLVHHVTLERRPRVRDERELFALTS
jgi:predicted transcriptional regulator